MIKLFSLKQQKQKEEGDNSSTGPESSGKKVSAAEIRLQKGIQ